MIGSENIQSLYFQQKQQHFFLFFKWIYYHLQKLSGLANKNKDRYSFMWLLQRDYFLSIYYILYFYLSVLISSTNTPT
ncbi:hypothetical protein pb186bvf_001944 [Paramecium bursaria]